MDIPQFWEFQIETDYCYTLGKRILRNVGPLRILWKFIVCVLDAFHPFLSDFVLRYCSTKCCHCDKTTRQITGVHKWYMALFWWTKIYKLVEAEFIVALWRKQIVIPDGRHQQHLCGPHVVFWLFPLLLVLPVEWEGLQSSPSHYWSGARPYWQRSSWDGETSVKVTGLMPASLAGGEVWWLMAASYESAVILCDCANYQSELRTNQADQGSVLII